MKAFFGICLGASYALALSGISPLGAGLIFVLAAYGLWGDKI